MSVFHIVKGWLWAGQKRAASTVEAGEPKEEQQESHSRLGRASIAPSEVLMNLGEEALVFVGLSGTLPLLHTYSYTFKTLKEF